MKACLETESDGRRNHWDHVYDQSDCLWRIRLQLSSGNLDVVSAKTMVCSTRKWSVGLKSAVPALGWARMHVKYAIILGYRLS